MFDYDFVENLISKNIELKKITKDLEHQVKQRDSQIQVFADVLLEINREPFDFSNINLN